MKKYILLLTFLFSNFIFSQTTVKMEKINGIFQIPCSVNGVPMDFIFDTGASDVSISITEAKFLAKQGLLNNEDILGNVNYQLANGDIEKGTVIVLRTLKIGDIILKNVMASIVYNQNAPLLLGQSALSQFGEYTISGNLLIIRSSISQNSKDLFASGSRKLKHYSESSYKYIGEFEEGLSAIRDAVKLSPNLANNVGELGKIFYENKSFSESSKLFEIAISNRNSLSFALDNFYYGNSIFYLYAKSSDINRDDLTKADKAFETVISISPTTQDAYVFRARINRLLENETMIIKCYEEYIKILKSKSQGEINANKKKLIEAYNNLGASYANFDRTKAIQCFRETVSLDPNDSYAINSLKILN